MAVQISGNDITVPRDTTITRNLTVGGVLTYEDVTNVDSVGLVTARSGIEIGARPGVAASISVDGNMVVSGITTIGNSNGGNEKLNVHGAIRSSTSSADFNAGLEGTLVDYDISGNASRFGHVNGASGSARPVIFLTGGAEKFRIAADGVITAQKSGSFGNTSDSFTSLNITSSTSGISELRFADTTANAGYIKYEHSSNDFIFATTGASAGMERLRIASGGDVKVGTANSLSGLRYLDVSNTSNAANAHGAILRLITSNAAATGTTSVDIVKYKDGNFFISNNETTGETKLNTGGSTSLNISAAGYVTKSKTPFFSVYGTANNQTYNDGDILTFENATQNVGSHFKMDAGTGQYQRFIAPVAGVYIFTMGFFPNSASSCRIQLAVDGVNQTAPYINGCFTAWGTGLPAPAGAQMLKLGANSYVDVRISGGTLTNTYDGHTAFQGFLLG